jgi:hypothetical protein
MAEKAPAVTPTSAPISTRWQDRFSQTMPDFTGLTVKESLQLARSQKLELYIEGSGLAVSQSVPIHTAGAVEVTVTFQERKPKPPQEKKNAPTKPAP